MPNPKNEVRRSSYVLFFPLLFIMLLFEIIHIPAAVAPYRPDFLATLLIFFVTIDPKRINIGLTWISGLLLDLLSGAPIGSNALVLSAQLCLILVYFKNFVHFMVWQQMLAIGSVNLLCPIAVYWICHIIGQASYTTHFLWQAFVTMLLWPVFVLLYRFLWSFFRVSSFSTKSENDL